MFVNNKYQQAMLVLRDNIFSHYNNGVRAKNVFLQKIAGVVGV
uniref:Uncharacterized protein n=1 Tax=Meloidogyne enterolobii TaxID=390850 RepID=A0A6V7XJQ5_MELEN|nr:unnamed protein product [Meloidogyne enterolobii]